MKMITDKAWYPGTPEQDRFDYSQNNERDQVIIVDIERGENPIVEYVKTGYLKWHNINVSSIVSSFNFD